MAAMADSSSVTMPPLEADTPAPPPPSTASASSVSSSSSSSPSSSPSKAKAAIDSAVHHPSTDEMDLELKNAEDSTSASDSTPALSSATDMNGNGNSHGHDEDAMDSSAVDDSSSTLDSPHTHVDSDSHDLDDSSHSHSSPSASSASRPWVWEKPPERVVYLTEKLFHLENRKLRGYKLVPIATLPSAYVLEDNKRKREVKPKPDIIPAIATQKPDGLKRKVSTAVSSVSSDEHDIKKKDKKAKTPSSTSSHATDVQQQIQTNQNQIAELQLKLLQMQQQQMAMQYLSLGTLMNQPNILSQPNILQPGGLPLGGLNLNPYLAQSLALMNNPVLSLAGAANPAVAAALAASAGLGVPASTPTESKKALKRKLSTAQTPTLKRKNSMADSPPLTSSSSSSSSSSALPTSIPTPIPLASATPTASKHGRSIKKHSLNATLDPSLLPPALRKARNVIDNLMKHKLNVQGVFNVPVNHSDPSKPYFANNYLEMITPYGPMDLGTVKTKLNTGEYNSLDELANDVRTIWRNAMQYNSIDSWIHTNADQLGKLFEADYIKLSQSPATTPAAKPKKAKKEKSAQPKSAKNEEQLREELAELNSKVSQGINDGVPAHELSHLHKRIHQIESELKASKESAAKSSSSKKSKASASAPAAVTKDEKKKLQQDIYTINESNPDVLEGVIDIIRKSVNINSEDEGKEVEIDIDSLPPHTVRELQSYVAEAMRKLMEGKPNPEIKENAEAEEYQSSRAQSLIDSDDENTHDTLDD